MIARKFARKVLSIVLMICLMFASVGVAYGQTLHSDIEGHWAENQLRSWISQGLIKGYTDGSLKPNNEITRGEFMVLVNRLFQFNKTTSIGFTDLIVSDWEYIEVQKAVEAGYIQGYEDQTIRSSKPLSRQEAAVVVAHLLNLPNDEWAANLFKDASAMALWSKGAVGAAASKNIVTGYADPIFKPEANITRAEAVVMLDNAKSLTLEKPPANINNGGTPTPTPTPTPAPSGNGSGNDGNGNESPSPSPSLPTTTGVSGTTSITTAGTLATAGVSQVATLTITTGATATGTLRVTFTDGTTPVAVNVTLTGTEAAASVATRIAAAFGTTITGWNVTVSGKNVLFTASAPAANNTNVTATVEGAATGVGTPSSTITTPGAAMPTGIAQVATLAISNGATAAGSIYVKFTDGTTPVSVNVSIAGTEAAADVATKIATAFGTSIIGWNVTASGTNVQFTAQTPAANNASVAISVFEASGVGAPISTITTLGNLGTNTAQVVTLTLPGSESSGGPIGVKFTDGTTSVSVNVTMLDSPETGAQLATKIAAAFGTSIPGWNVSASSTSVLFTANVPAVNNTKAVARLSGMATGIGMPDSTITIPGAAMPTGIAQVATLAISNGATAAGSIYVKFTDGTTPVSVNVSIAGTETAADVATKIAAAFGTSIGWNVTTSGTNVQFTAQTPAANNASVAISVFEASGVGAPTSTITTLGNLGTNTAQVVTLTLPGSESSGGPIGVKFTDGTTSVSVNVTMLDSPETGAQLATKIAAAFGTSIPGWNVSASSTSVLFTANAPAVNNTKAVARLSGIATGIGMPDSTITTPGATTTTGIAQVATLAIANGATVAGSIHAKFTDGTTPVSVNVYIAGTETAADVATKIAAAFGTSISGWNVTASGTNVQFTVQAPVVNNANVAATVEEVATGVGTPSSTITTAGTVTTAGVAQVATLTITTGATAAGTLRVTFTDGTTPVAVNVTLTGTETAASVATKIAAAFGTTITGWNVTVNGTNVLFTVSTPAANNTNVSVIIHKE
ncbi:S-layer homology domain-containing protein [Paenibacillus sp. SYP-B3998]|uniref:S-layer homology domain-containing protein n=1 Tax=Paenibacillus sp. SYP-B3998 TaxID=2678564 RepID=A0A6G4A423_9BACL|nr:S-layer homology domain-containing protein [Paenibacillus sp. SYP-B3998]NEW09080.1 S-layer homology domain-containing protein [Paenibacillus sp. SYP-B3998]